MERSEEGLKQPPVVPRTIFEAKPIPTATDENCYAPFDAFTHDDDLIYPVPNAAPVLLTLSPKFNTRPFLFDGVVSRAPATILVDSGASASFVSLHWCRKHHINPLPVSVSHGRLANQTSFPIHGRLAKAHLRLGGFKTKQEFLVADLPGLDVVLGLDFLEEYDPSLRWKKRTMEINDPNSHIDNVYIVHAQRSSSLPQIDSNCIELCTIQEFADLVSRGECDGEELFLGFVRCTDSDSSVQNDEHLYAGKGAQDPRVAEVISEFSDVLVSKLPAGIPPERIGIEGNPIEHTIELAPGTKPFAANPRRLTPAEDQEMHKVLKLLFENGWIGPSLSPHAAPVVFSRKKPDPVTGQVELRMCISYVKLNKNTLNKIAYRLPHIATLLDQVTAAQYFTKLDLTSGYWQIPMRAQDIPKTGFTTPYGNFEFRVMPFGLCGAPATFQHMMDTVFGTPTELQSSQNLSFAEFVAIYLDDVCIFSNTIDDHLMHIRAVLSRLRSYKLYAKPSKCEWMQRSIQFLGHQISAEGKQADRSKVDALQSWPSPTNRAELRTLLGTFGYWRPYIKNYARIVAPLTALTSEKSTWIWNATHALALTDLKRALLESPVLMRPDQEKPFILITDASDFAVGASLEQLDNAENRRPVAFFSHSLNPAERNYQTFERELLAIVLALRTWRHYLEGSAFTVECHTDHRPLVSFMMHQQERGRLVRWQQFLTSYNLQIHHLAGKENVFADGLSRRPDLRLMLTSACTVLDPATKAIVQSQRKDSFARKRMQDAQNPNVKTNWKLVSGTLMFGGDDLLRLYVPDDLRTRIIREQHDNLISGHFGWQTVYHALSQWYYWPSMKADVKSFVKACPHCQLYKPTVQPTTEILPSLVQSRPFSEISLDWMSGLPKTVRKNDSVLNVIDRFSKWAIIIPCDKKMTSQKLIDILYEHVFSWVGLPVRIIGDRDTRLTADRMRALCKGLHVKLALSASYRPQTDGSTERFNRTFLSMLRTCCNKDPKNWDKAIPSLRYAYNNTVHTATGFTPHYLLFGWKPIDLRVPLAFQNESIHSDIDSFLSRRAATFSIAKSALERARMAMIAQRNASANAHVYKVGDLVKISSRVLRPQATAAVPRKMQRSYGGPFEVTALLGPKTLSVALPQEYAAINNAFNFEDIRPWLNHEAHAFEPDYPAVEPHPSANHILKIVDRRALRGSSHAGLDFLDIPCEYQVLWTSGDMEWLPSSASELHDDESARQQLIAFEMRFPRDASRPCNPIEDYPAESDPGYVSPDELPLALHQELNERL